MNILPDNNSNVHNNQHVTVRRHALDMGRARRLFAGLEKLAREARDSDDPRVLLNALRVLTLQPANVRELLAQEVCLVR